MKSGETVLVYGASGCVGSAAVQLARHFGAHVTGVTSSANVDLVREIGAHDVIDYQQQNLADGDRRWDIVIDTIGTRPYQQFRALLAPDGRLLMVAADLPTMLVAPLLSLTGRHSLIAGPAASTPADLRFLAQLAEAGEFRPVIDQVFTLHTITSAHRRVASGRKRGSVVVLVDGPRQAAP